MRQLSFLALVACTAACSDAGPAPTVSVLEAMPATLHPADDARNDLTIRVEYHDADGDLGRGVARIHDCRAGGLVTEKALPAIASDEAVREGVAITGELTLLVNDVGPVAPDAAAPPVCADAGIAAPAAGQAVFCVVLVDATGHEGNADCTAPIAIE